MNNYLFVKDIPFGSDLLKKDRNFLKKELVIHAFDYIAIQVPSFQSYM
jgi:hypothetical protein